MDKQITNVIRSTYLHLRNIGSIRHMLTQEATEKLVHALVTSRIDYCNSVLASIPDYKCQRLQKVQNTAARIITRTPKHDHITAVLKELHWIKISSWIEFKILLLVYKILNNMAPSYLCELISHYQPSR